MTILASLRHRLRVLLVRLWRPPPGVRSRVVRGPGRAIVVKLWLEPMPYINASTDMTDTPLADVGRVLGRAAGGLEYRLKASAWDGPGASATADRGRE